MVGGLKCTYKRHGTLNLFAALNVAAGAVCGKGTQLKRRVEFLAFMDELLEDYRADMEIDVFLDNYCIDKMNEEWLGKHAKVLFHFTPTSASWLNMVEIWFGMFSRKALRGSNFKCMAELRDGIEAYLEAYKEIAKRFVWARWVARQRRDVGPPDGHRMVAGACWVARQRRVSDPWERLQNGVNDFSGLVSGWVGGGWAGCLGVECDSCAFRALRSTWRVSISGYVQRIVNVYRGPPRR